MPADPRLAALPALRKRAEKEARFCHYAQVAAIKAKHHGYYAQDLIDALPPAWVDVDAHLTLLTDLSRPESRDAVARLVAQALGLECGATAPTLRRYDSAGSPMPTGDGGLWTLYSGGDRECQWHPFATWPKRPVRFYAPEIAATTDPAEAITLIAIAVLGGAS